MTVLFVVALVALSSFCSASQLPPRILPAIFVGVDEDGGEPEAVYVDRTYDVMFQGGNPPLRLVIGPVKQDGDYLTAECVVEGGTESFSVRVGKREPLEVVCKGVLVRFSAGEAPSPEYGCGLSLFFRRWRRENRLQEAYEHRMNKEKEEAAVAEFRHTALFVPTYAAIFFSNSLVLGPVVIQPLNIASDASLASSSVMSGGEKGIFLSFIFILQI